MTPEEIQAIRAKYNYNPQSLQTSSSGYSPSVSDRLALLRGEEKPAEEKTTLQKVGDVAGSIISAPERLGGAALNLAGMGINAASEALGGQANSNLTPKAQRTGLFGNTVDTLGYKDGQALHGGELAKDIAGNVLQNAALLSPTKVTSLGGLTKAGAIAGAEQGAGTALQRQEDAVGVITSGLLGAGTGAVIGAAVPATGKVVSTIKNKLSPSEQFIESQIVNQFTKGVKPVLPGKTTPSLMNKYKDNVVTAVKTIKSNKDNLNFIDETGDVLTGQTPKNISQLNDAVEQTKKILFTQYDDLAKKAGAQGITIDVTPIANELDSIIGNKSLSITNPNAVQYAQSLKDRLSSVGKIDAQTAQDVIQNYNKSLEAFYRNPTYDNASNAAIDSVVANNMRKALDDGISGLTGSEYQTLKNQYGALKAIEKDVIKASLKEARKNAKGLIDFTDIFSGGQVASGILSMNPSQIASGATQKGIAALYKHLNDPNRAISKMFEAADIPVGGVVGKISKELKKPEYRRGMVNPSELLPKKAISSLEQEAKGKTLDEFVKGQGKTTYRSTDKPFDKNLISERGIFTTPDKNYAINWKTGKGRSIEELIIDKKANILSKDKIPKEFYSTEDGIKYLNNEEDLIKYAKKNGFDGYESVSNINGQDFELELVVFNKNMITTKSQLTDIWNKANKSQPLQEGVNLLIQEAKKTLTPTKVYHGTPNDFKGEPNFPLYLTSDKKYADIYQNPSASSLSSGKKAGKPITKEFTVNPNAKVLDSRTPEGKALLKDYWDNYSVSGMQVKTESGLPDWTEGTNLEEFLAEKGYKYDAILLDEGGVPSNSGVKSRGVSFVALNKNAFK